MLMFHFGMTKEEIGNSSMPFIFAILSTLGKRFCENLGVPYKKKDDEEESEDEEELSNEEYPKLYTMQPDKNNKNSSKGKYKASSKQDIMDFFGGMASFEDS